MAQQEHIVIMNYIMRSINNLKQNHIIWNFKQGIISWSQLGPNSFPTKLLGLDQMHVINDFPTDYKSCSTFNIENLAAYKGPAITPYDTSHQLSHDPIKNPMTHPAPPNISPTCKEFRISTLFVSTGNGGVQYCLIHWKGR